MTFTIFNVLSKITEEFYINDNEVINNISDTLHYIEIELSKIADSGGEDNRISYEQSIAISYTPLSIYRVRPVTR